MAQRRRTLTRGLVGMVLVGLLLVSGVGAAPLVNNSSGTWYDTYNDALGVYNSNNVVNDPRAGIMQLAAGQAAGWYDTVLIRPTSFDAWQRVVVEATYAAPANLTVDILDEGETAIPGYQGLLLGPGGLVDISGINPGSYPALRVRLNLTRGATAPVVASLQVEWHAISRLLLDKAGPAQVEAGQPIVYTVRYSVSFVQAQGLVVWDPLPTEAAGTVVYPQDYGQNDEPTFVWASGGGQYCAPPGPCSVNGISVPGHSVYWRLGDVPAGRTDSLLFAVMSPNGALDGTLYRNSARADAANAAAAVSDEVETVLTSVPAPGIDKRGGAGTVVIDGRTWAGWAGGGRTVQFVVSDPMGGGGDGNACPRGVGCERMYNVVLYDNVSDLVGPPAKVIYTPGDPCSAFTNISGGGTCNPAYTPPAGGGPFPAIVWNLAPFAPSAAYYQTFEVTLVDNPVPDGYLDDQACLDSDQTDPVCDTLRVYVGMDDNDDGIFSKGDDLNGDITYHVKFNDDSRLYAREGGTVKYLLHATNKGATILNDVIMADIILPGTQFVAASLPPAANGRIFYATTAAYPDTHVPPPVDYVQAPADIDPVGSDNWFPYPPANPSAVTWIAFYIPQVSQNWLPPNPISTVVGEYTVLIAPLADPCSGTTLTDWGQFYAFQHQPFGGGPIVPIVPTLYREDWEVTQVVVEIPELNVDPSLAYFDPVYVAPRGEANYYLTVQNRDVDTSDTSYNTRVELQWSQVPVNGGPTYLDFISVSGGVVELLDPANGRVVLNLGTLVPGDSRNVELHLGVPVGVEDGSQFSVVATVSGEDDECPVPPGVVTAYGHVYQAMPQLQVIKDDVLDVIPGGELLTYTLTFNGIGTAPSHDTFIVDRIPDRMVFLQATGPHGELVYVSNREPPDLPPDLLVTQTLSQADIAAYFTLATLHDNGTPGNPSDDWWTSPYGEATTWIAWLVDDPALGLFPVGVTHQVSMLTRNDEDRGPAQVDSVDGTLIFNEEGVFSDELLQAIGNEVITTIDETPGLVLRKTGPEIVCSEEVFDWVVVYTNTSWVADDIVTIRDTLPEGVTFLSASHTWNVRALANGADPGNNGQPVPSTVTNNPDGTTLVTFNIADPYRGGDLRSLEGGRITLHVQTDAGLPSGTFLTNNVCGEAANLTGTIALCTEHTVEVRLADLWLRKGVDIPDPRAGDTVTWMLFLSNEGLHEATDVVLQDTLPAGMTYVPGSTHIWTAHYTSGQPAVAGQTLTWSVANGNAFSDDRYSPARPGVLRPGSETVYITFQAVVNGGTPPGTTLTNNASVSTATCEDTAYANTASSSARTPFPDLALYKYGPEIAYPGSVVTWHVTYRNVANEDAQDSWVVDTLPDYNADNAVDVLYLSSWAGPGPNGAVSSYWHAGPVAPRPAFDPLNPLSNGWVADPTAVVVTHIAYNVGNMPRHAGPYDIWVQVQLSDPITGLPLPAGIALTNYAEVFTLSTEERYDNNSDTATVRTPGLDLALEKTGSTEGPYPGLLPGEALSYEIVYRNLGTSTAYGVKVTDTVPVNVTLQTPPDDFLTVLLADEVGNPVTPVDGSGDPIAIPVPVTRVQAGPLITWYLGTTNPADTLYYRNVGVPSRAQGTFTIFTYVNLDTPNNTAIVNPARVSTDRRNDGEPPEEYLENNWDDSSVVVYTADVWVEKQVVDVATGSEQWTDAGSVLSYTVWYGNAGSTAAEDVEITEIIPEGTTYVQGSLIAPPGARVEFYPNVEEPTEFTIFFLSPLLAPATYATQDADTGWLGTTLVHTQVGDALYPRLATAEAGEFDDVGAWRDESCLGTLDANGDGAPDLVAVGHLWLNNGDGTFVAVDAGDWHSGSQTFSLYGQSAFDANADGHVDLVGWHVSPDALGLFLGDGTGHFDLVQDLSTSANRWSVFDADGDGDQDIAILPAYDEVVLLDNDGYGVFTPVEAGALDDPTGRSWIPLTTAVGAIVDVDGDGDLDIARVGWSSGTTQPLYINDGSGVFTTQPGGDLDTTPSSVFYSMDWDQDGDADLLSSGRVWVNDGNGVFTIITDWRRTGDFSNAWEPSKWANLADINEDGTLDVVNLPSRYDSVNWENQVYLNDGVGRLVYNQAGPYGFERYVAAYNTSVALLDADNDGHLDLAAMPRLAGDMPRFYLNQAPASCITLAAERTTRVADAGAFAQSRNIYDLATLDANGDGYADIVISNLSQPNLLYLNDGHGTFTQAEAGQYDDGSRTSTSVVAFDVDSDGDTDLVVGNYNSASALYLNDGTGTFTQVDAGQFDDVTTHYVYTLAAFDVDGDGDTDLLKGNGAGSQFSYLYLNNGAGSFTQIDAGQLDDVYNPVRDIAVFDADGDDDLDVVMGNTGQVSRLYLNDGSGVFTLLDAGQLDDAASNVRALAAFDADGDGDVDVAKGNYSQWSQLYLNNGAGSFTQSTNTGVFGLYYGVGTPYTTALVPIDIDGDGDTDLAMGSRHSGATAVVPSLLYINDGTGKFSMEFRGAFGYAGPTLLTADLRLLVLDADADGDADLATAYYAQPNNGIYLNTGLYEDNATVTSGVITPATLYPEGGALLAWDWLLVAVESPAGTAITFDVLNPATGTPFTGMAGLYPDEGGRISLSGLDVATVPAIELRAHLRQLDAGYGNDDEDPTPALCGWTTTFRMGSDPFFTFQVLVNDPLQGGQARIDNVATIETTTPETDYTNNVATDTIWLRLTDLQIVKEVDKAAAMEGEPLLYTLQWRNNGPQSAPNSWVTDTLPVGVTYVAGSATPPETRRSGNGTPGNPWTLAWSLGTLAVGQEGTILIPVTINSGTAGQVLHNTTVIATSRAETRYDNNYDDADTYVGTLANIWIEKTGPVWVLVGGRITYTLTYGNNGNSPAPNVVVSDTLPAGVTFVSATPPPEEVAGQVVRWTTVGTLNSGQTGSITLVGQVANDPGLVDTVLHNTVTIATTVQETTLADNADYWDSYVLLEPCRVSGYVWWDRDEDLIRGEANEPGLGQVAIQLIGTDFRGQPVSLSTQTDAAGFYIFSDLLPGTYYITETQPLNYLSVGAVVGTLGGSVYNPDRIISIPPKSGDVGVEYNFGENNNPTAVVLTGFWAQAGPEGVWLRWETATEKDNVGFNVYRSVDVEEVGEQLNGTLIPSKSPGGDQGATYVYSDTTALPGVVYYYHLEDIDTGGHGTLHGPVEVMVWRVYLPLVLAAYYEGPARD